MLVTSALTGLYLAGVDGLAPAAARDATHPTTFFAIFAAALTVNIAAMVESVIRFRKNPDPLERRRIALSVWTLALGTFAFTVRDGVPAVVAALGGARFAWPAWIALPLYVLVALPAIGVTYAVAVHRVLSPRVAMRTSLQYALARKTLDCRRDTARDPAGRFARPQTRSEPGCDRRRPAADVRRAPGNVPDRIAFSRPRPRVARSALLPRRL